MKLWAHCVVEDLVMTDIRIPAPTLVNAMDLLFFGRPGIYSAQGAHIAHFFEEEKERLTVLAPFIRTGLTDNHQCLLITEPSRFATLEPFMRVANLGRLGRSL